ncbi:MAG: HD domain-containing protein [Deltaproteobacteria bacterium]|nr:HD domain-containing protein [Deltaproteobacteria bacterium]
MSAPQQMLVQFPPLQLNQSPKMDVERLQAALEEVRARKRTILVVDDEALLLNGIRRALKRMDVESVSAENAEQAVSLLEGGLQPDVVLTDQRMPGMSGSEFLSIVREKWPHIVRVCMSGHADRPEILEAINRGNVYRFLMKPWDLNEFQGTLQAAIEQSDLLRENAIMHQTLEAENVSLGAQVIERTRELAKKTKQLDDSLMDTVRTLAFTIEAKDAYTAGHSELVSQFAVALAQKIGLGKDEQQCLRLAGVLHDVGKIGVPDAVLLKPGRLTPAEFDQVKQHPEIGARILRDIQFPHDILPIVRLHHERWDGNGYPDGLKEDETPLLARLTHIVDVYEAITARRVYRNPMPLERVMEVYSKGKGSDFDPHLTDPFLELLEDGTFERIRNKAGLDVIQEVGEFTFRSAPKVELRED